MSDNKENAGTILCNHCQYKYKIVYVCGKLQVSCIKRGRKAIRTEVCKYYRTMDENPEARPDLLSWCD